MKNSFKTISCLTLFIIFLQSPVLAAQASELPEDVIKTVRARIEHGTNVGIVIGIIDATDPRYFNYGKMSLNDDRTPNENSVFEIGSITKVFTAILLMDMVEQGHLRLDDPIEKFLPQNVKVPSRNNQLITFEHLATHTSGLPRMPDNFNPADPGNPYRDYTIDLMYAFLSNHTLRRDIGERYEYSNYGAGLMGHILGLMNNLTYEELLTRRITDGLDLKDTRITLTQDMKNRLAKGHAGGVEVPNWDIQCLAGAGALRSTIKDMLRFLASNMGFEKSSLFPAMLKTHEPRFKAGRSNMHVGLGWHIMSRSEDKIIWHNGGTGGYRSFAGFLKKEKKGVVVLTNTNMSTDDIGFHLLDPSIPLREPKRSIAITLRRTIDAEGLKPAIQHYYDLKKDQSAVYNFAEVELNNLGYQYLSKGDIETAITIFQLNVEAYPDAANTYDSLGEAYMEQGNTELAIKNYKKSLELNPGNENAKQILSELGANADLFSKEITISTEILESYVGKYQLAPNFIMTISREGNQMMAQATAQPMLKIYPLSETKFFYKVVDAQISFYRDENGIVNSLTLHQNGRNIPGQKVE